MSLPHFSNSTGVSNTATLNTTVTINGNSQSYFTYTTPTVQYQVLGKTIDVEGFTDVNVAMLVSLINVLGIQYYVELCKNNITFPVRIQEFLETELVRLKRDNIINKIIDNEL